MAQCREELPIPTLMRGYMYTHDYRNLAQAKQALADVDLTRLACESCGTCTVTDCTMGFDVRERILDIARIRHVPDDFLS